MSTLKQPNQDQEIDQLLAQADEAGSRQAEAESAVDTLRAELETIAVRLREPVPAEPFESEPACGRAVEKIRGLASAGGPQSVVVKVGDAVDLEARTQVGPYKLLERLGQGGMGAVYKALHPRLEKTVALKVLRTERVTSDTLDRFDREMKALGKLDHPHLIRALDAGDADGTYYLVMEFVRGVDLSVLLAERGPLRIADACELIVQAAMGLHAAHSRGMVHRDIKPANLMLAEQEFGQPVVKVLDLGLALLAESQQPDRGGLTTDGQIMGTIDYMPPEQAENSHSVDLRADIYSLGATLYALLTGGSIFQGRPNQSVMQKLMALATMPIPPIRNRRPEVSDTLAAIVHRMLARNPNDRFESLARVIEALKPFTAGAELSELLADESDQTVLVSSPSVPSAPLREQVLPEASTTALEAAPPNVDRTPTSGQPDMTGRRRPAYGLIATAMAGVVLLGAILLSLKTPNGEVVVQIPDDLSAEVRKEIKISVTGDGTAEVASEANGWKIGIKEGEYHVELTGGRDQVQIEDKRVTVSRKKKAIVTIAMKDAGKTDAPKVTTPATPTAGDIAAQRKTAEWLIGNKKLLKIGFEVDGQLENLNVVPTKPFKVRELNFHYANNAGNLKPEDIPRLAVFTDVEKLNFAGQPLTDAGLASLSPLKQLKSLDVYSTELTSAAVATIRSFPALEYLQGPGNDEWLKALAGMPTLRSMWFYRQEVSLRALNWFEQYPKLTELRFGECGTWPSEKLASFKNCQSLSKLTLSYSPLDDGKIETLSGLTQLRELDLTGTHVTAEGVRKLAAALSECRIQADALTIGSQSDQLKLVEWLLGTESTFGTQAFQSAQITELPPAPWQVDSVNLRLSAPTQVREFVDLAAPLGTVNSLYVYPSPHLDGDGFRQLMRIKSLHRLTISPDQNADGIKMAELEMLSELPHLTALNFGDSPTTNDDAIKVVKKLTKVVELGFNSCPITDVGVEQLREMPQLTTLYVNSTLLTDKIWETLGQLPNLENLIVMGGPGVTGQGISQLQQKKLEQLSLDGTNLSNESLKDVAALPALRRLQISNTPIGDEGLKHLATSRLETLNVIATKVTAAGVAGLQKALPNCKIEWDAPKE